MSTDLTLHPIRTEADYRAALARAEALFDLPEEPDPDSDEGAFFEALITLIEAWERKHYPSLSPRDWSVNIRPLTPKTRHPTSQRRPA